MAYWGMAMANVNNSNRAAGFIKHAYDLKSKASPREVLWIDAYDAYFAGKKGDTDRRKDLVNALESLIQKHPKELEAKTFLAFQIWDNEGKGIPVTSRLAVDALMNEVLAVEPLHPVHHARIHTWNNKKDERALNSAARCGQSAPAIAHMWHMPGHTYSALKRYDDAAWQQEAAARTDHAYMMAARILPDQIHNFAHNRSFDPGPRLLGDKHAGRGPSLASGLSTRSPCPLWGRLGHMSSNPRLEPGTFAVAVRFSAHLCNR